MDARCRQQHINQGVGMVRNHNGRVAKTQACPVDDRGAGIINPDGNARNDFKKPVKRRKEWVQGFSNFKVQEKIPDGLVKLYFFLKMKLNLHRHDENGQLIFNNEIFVHFQSNGILFRRQNHFLIVFS